MARRSAEVVRGARGPMLPGGETVVDAVSAKRPPDQPALAKKPGFRRFASSATGYRLTVTMPDSFRDPSTGRKVDVPGKSAVFKEGYFETEDAETIERLERLAVRAPGDVWDLDVAEANQQDQAADALVDLVKGGGVAVLSKIKEALGLSVTEEFEVPKPKEAEAETV